MFWLPDTRSDGSGTKWDEIDDGGKSPQIYNLTPNTTNYHYQRTNALQRPQSIEGWPSRRAETSVASEARYMHQRMLVLWSIFQYLIECLPMLFCLEVLHFFKNKFRGWKISNILNKNPMLRRSRSSRSFQIYLICHPILDLRYSTITAARFPTVWPCQSISTRLPR